MTDSNPYYSAVSADDKWLAVSNYDDESVGLVNLSTGQVTIIPMEDGDNPGGIAFSPDSTKIYVASTGDHVDVIDVATAAWESKITNGAWSEVWALSITPDGTKLLVDDYDNDYFYTYTLATSTLSSDFSTSDTYDILPTSDSAYAYLTQYNGTIKYVRLSDMNEMWSTSVSGASIVDATLSADGAHIYFAENNSGDEVYDFVTADQSSTSATVSGAIDLWGAALSKDGKFLYVADYIGDGAGLGNGGSVFVIDPNDLSVLETVAVGDYNQAVATDSLGCAFVSDYYGSTYQLNDCRPATPELPNTGSSVNPSLAGFGVVSLLAGLAAVVIVTRRRAGLEA